MVSFASIFAACVAAAATSVSADFLSDLPVGVYFRPEGPIVSAAPNTTAPFRRAPCPFLNSLANHGYLPRDGKNVSRSTLRDVIVSKMNLDPAFVNIMLGPIPTEIFDMNVLGTHGLAEHDASLVRADSYFGFDPVRIDPLLVADVLTRGDGQTYSIKELGELRRDRLANCLATNPQCSFTQRDATISFGEAAMIADVLSGNKNSTISKAHLKSFLVEERFPADFVKSPTVVTAAQIAATSTKIVAAASTPKA